MIKPLPFSLSYYLGILALTLLLGACASRENIQYFQKIDYTQLSDSIAHTEPEIQVGDLLNITITATNAEAALPFNLFEAPIIGTMNVNAARPLPYLVDTDGYINFPVLGQLHIAGNTTKALTLLLEDKLSSYIQDPVINIRFANFRVSVLGEVNKPGTFPVTNEHVSIIEAITLAGDLTIYGKRDEVLLIRMENGTKKYIPLDLTQKTILESPYFYVKQNDIIYINPNKTKVNASAVGPNTSVILSSLSILLTVIGLLI
ncbi:polysaccharide biosynthesis/export family protein [Pseudotamlana carrageenivorans]|uniref:Sugar transporter n=1 Tax=Pseudotamlana carrageenivorans TaxID=2069432 RepID=A0A2I7SIU0_9FLAO|nr:polysaccharide biosynthesis/export family protein [Tamlana carrageenivorans]AUS05826.1 sugar transporter [Tamlana carrageenivorans]